MKINCGDNIKKYRILSGLSQTELGDKLGVKHGAVSSWEINRTEPKIGHIEQMCLIFGCKKSDLIGEHKEVPENYVSGTMELIDLYSKASPETRKAVLNLLRTVV